MDTLTLDLMPFQQQAGEPSGAPTPPSEFGYLQPSPSTDTYLQPSPSTETYLQP